MAYKSVIILVPRDFSNRSCYDKRCIVSPLHLDRVEEFWLWKTIKIDRSRDDKKFCRYCTASWSPNHEPQSEKIAIVLGLQAQGELFS